MWHRFCLVLLLFSLVGCGREEAPPPAATKEGSVEAAPVSDEVATIVANFAQLRVMTSRPDNSQAPQMCAVFYVDEAPGTEGPHAEGFIKVFMDEQAAEAFEKASKSYPVGSVIVKEKLLENASIIGDRKTYRHNGVGGMIKRDPGYDPEHGDWEYFFVDDQTPLQSGRIGTCVDCHQNASDRDYVFGTWPHRPMK